MKKKSKLFSAMCLSLTAMLLVGCSGDGGSNAGKGESNAGSDNTTVQNENENDNSGGVKITLLNTKSELVEQFEAMAVKYKEQTGVTIEPIFNSDVVSTHLAEKYASGNPYTIMMVDRADVYDFREYLLDLSNEKWIDDGGSSYGVASDDKVYSFPMLIESVGLLYNAEAIESVTGETFDPKAYDTMEKFEELLAKLASGGIEKPIAVNKEDWSLANHYFGQLYNQQGNSEESSQAFVDSLKSGKTKLMSDQRFLSLMDSFDLLAKYNINSEDPLSAEYDMNNLYFSEGEVAFWYNGSWATEVYDKTEKIGMMPLPQKDNKDDVNTRLISGASKSLVIDQEYATTEQQQAAKDFLDWLVYDEAGQSFMVDDCSIIPAFSNIKKEVSAPLSVSAQKYIQDEKTEYWYQTIPGDHGTEVGASLQKYLSSNISREELAVEVEAYWTKQK